MPVKTYSSKWTISTALSILLGAMILLTTDQFIGLCQSERWYDSATYGLLFFVGVYAITDTLLGVGVSFPRSDKKLRLFTYEREAPPAKRERLAALIMTIIYIYCGYYGLSRLILCSV